MTPSCPSTQRPIPREAVVAPPSARKGVRWAVRSRFAALVVAAVVATVASAGIAIAQPARPSNATEQGVPWRELKPAQRDALKPLERNWSTIDASQKEKWMALSTRFPTMTPAEQGRVQERMSEWAKLTPLQRGEARLNFQQAKQLPPKDRQARWDAYQALTPEEKRQLAARAAAGPEAARASTSRGVDKNGRDGPQLKSNIVPNPSFAAPPKAIAPTEIQARPGATTTSITRQPAPPPHEHAGLPKIAATPEFVNKATLLPKRGPQGAAAGPAAAPREERPIRK